MTRNRLNTHRIAALRIVTGLAVVPSITTCGTIEDSADVPELGAVVVTQWVDGTELSSNTHSS